MRLIILSAGIGSRLMPLTKDLPKSLIDLGNGVTLIEKQLNKAMECDQIDEIVIVTGYCSEKIEDFLIRNKFSKPIYIEYNPFYAVSNNLLSLWSVRHLLYDKDCIISNGDNLYKNDFFKKIILQIKTEGIFVTIDHKKHYDNDDMKVAFHNGLISRIHKDIPESDAKAESVGLVWLKGKASRHAFCHALVTLSKNPDNIQKFWLETLNELIRNRQEILPITVNHDDWLELDFHPDMEMMKQILFVKSDGDS